MGDPGLPLEKPQKTIGDHNTWRRAQEITEDRVRSHETVGEQRRPRDYGKQGKTTRDHIKPREIT